MNALCISAAPRPAFEECPNMITGVDCRLSTAESPEFGASMWCTSADQSNQVLVLFEEATNALPDSMSHLLE